MEIVLTFMRCCILADPRLCADTARLALLLSVVLLPIFYSLSFDDNC